MIENTIDGFLVDMDSQKPHTCFVFNKRHRIIYHAGFAVAMYRALLKRENRTELTEKITFKPRPDKEVTINMRGLLVDFLLRHNWQGLPNFERWEEDWTPI